MSKKPACLAGGRVLPEPKGVGGEVKFLKEFDKLICFDYHRNEAVLL